MPLTACDVNNNGILILLISLVHLLSTDIARAEQLAALSILPVSSLLPLLHFDERFQLTPTLLCELIRVYSVLSRLSHLYGGHIRWTRR